MGPESRSLSAKERILVVDDKPDITITLAEYLYHLDPERFEVLRAHSGEEGLEYMRRETFDLVFLDVNMGQCSGLDVLRVGRQERLARKYVLMSGENEAHDAIEAFKQGASDFLIKPLNPNQLRDLITHLLPKTSSPDDDEQWRHRYAPGVIGNHPSILKVLYIIQRVAATNATVLITGEAGTGKELVARALHAASERAEGPFMAINVTATGEDLFESSLFGWAKGAFTGATNNHAGFFEEADKGSIFLDEVGDLKLHQQPKLLRVLQTGHFYRVGEQKERHTNARVIAATNQSLHQRVKEGAFRGDLYYRLNVIPIHVPALRERASDIPLLADHFLRRNAQNHPGLNIELTPEAKGWLEQRPWPGNIRELEHALRRVCLMYNGSGKVTVQDLVEILDFPFAKPSPTTPPEPHSGDNSIVGPQVGLDEKTTSTEAPSTALSGESEFPYSSPGKHRYPDQAALLSVISLPEQGLSLRDFQEQLEVRLIWEAMVAKGFVRARAAELLGTHRTTLVEKIKKLAKVYPRLAQEKPQPGDADLSLEDLRRKAG